MSSAELLRDLEHAFPRMTRAQLETAARLLLDESQYLVEHTPEGDELVGKFPCSGKTYHRCSFMGIHSPECEAGEPTPHSPRDGAAFTTPPCSRQCEEGEPLPWCQVNGHDCPDCRTVLALRELVAEVPA